MKISKKVVSLGMLAGVSSLLAGCASQSNVIRTNEFSVSGDTAYNNVLKASTKTVLASTLKASDVKMLDKIYGSSSIDESKLLSQAKVKSGAAYLEQIGKDSGLIVANDEDAKNALRYMEQQKMAVKELASDLLSDEDAQKMLEQNMVYSVKHVLVNSEEDAKKMKEYLVSGEEKFDTLKDKSAEAKQSGAKDVQSDKGIVVLEAADYPNVPKGQMVAEFEKAATTTSPLNAWSDPVKTSFGYHLQYVYARGGLEGDSQDLTTQKQKIADKMIQTGKSDSKVIAQAMVKLREKNNFSITVEDLQKEYETYKKELVTAFDAEKESILSGDSAQSQGQQVSTTTA